MSGLDVVGVGVVGASSEAGIKKGVSVTELMKLAGGLQVARTKTASTAVRPVKSGGFLSTGDFFECRAAKVLLNSVRKYGNSEPYLYQLYLLKNEGTTILREVVSEELDRGGRPSLQRVESSLFEKLWERKRDEEGLEEGDDEELGLKETYQADCVEEFKHLPTGDFLDDSEKISDMAWKQLLSGNFGRERDASRQQLSKGDRQVRPAVRASSSRGASARGGAAVVRQVKKATVAALEELSEGEWENGEEPTGFASDAASVGTVSMEQARECAPADTGRGRALLRQIKKDDVSKPALLRLYELKSEGTEILDEALSHVLEPGRHCSVRAFRTKIQALIWEHDKGNYADDDELKLEFEEDLTRKYENAIGGGFIKSSGKISKRRWKLLVTGEYGRRSDTGHRRAEEAKTASKRGTIASPDTGDSLGRRREAVNKHILGLNIPQLVSLLHENNVWVPVRGNSRASLIDILVSSSIQITDIRDYVAGIKEEKARVKQVVEKIMRKAERLVKKGVQRKEEDYGRTESDKAALTSVRVNGLRSFCRVWNVTSVNLTKEEMIANLVLSVPSRYIQEFAGVEGVCSKGGLRRIQEGNGSTGEVGRAIKKSARVRREEARKLMTIACFKLQRFASAKGCALSGRPTKKVHVQNIVAKVSSADILTFLSRVKQEGGAVAQTVRKKRRLSSRSVSGEGIRRIEKDQLTLKAESARLFTLHTYLLYTFAADHHCDQRVCTAEGKLDKRKYVRHLVDYIPSADINSFCQEIEQLGKGVSVLSMRRQKRKKKEEQVLPESIAKDESTVSEEAATLFKIKSKELARFGAENNCDSSMFVIKKQYVRGLALRVSTEKIQEFLERARREEMYLAKSSLKIQQSRDKKGHYDWPEQVDKSEAIKRKEIASLGKLGATILQRLGRENGCSFETSKCKRVVVEKLVDCIESSKIEQFLKDVKGKSAGAKRQRR